jgi:hypothetical protein
VLAVVIVSAAVTAVAKFTKDKGQMRQLVIILSIHVVILSIATQFHEKERLKQLVVHSYKHIGSVLWLRLAAQCE